MLWLATLNLPDLHNFEERKISSSTKILDRTEEVILFDVHENFERILVDYDEISPLIINAAIAIEDQKFYEHPGIDVKAIFRAIVFTAMAELGIRDDVPRPRWIDYHPAGDQEHPSDERKAPVAQTQGMVPGRQAREATVKR